MRLSRSRVLLRVVLLAVGGVVLLVRGVLLLHAPANPTSARVGAVQLVVALLALVTAAGAAASLRKRRRDPTFRMPREPISGAPARKEEESSMPQQVPPGVIDGATARRLAEAGAVVVDVRTPAEFAAGHVPGARNVPYDEVARRVGEIGPPTTRVVVYCRSGQRSAVARRELRRLGFEQVWDAQRYDAWPRP